MTGAVGAHAGRPRVGGAVEFFEHALMHGYGGIAGAVLALGVGVSEFARRRRAGLLV